MSNETTFLNGSGTDEEPFPDFSEMSCAADALLTAYSSLVSQGFPPSSVAPAMLKATIRFYDMFELNPLLSSHLSLAVKDTDLHGEFDPHHSLWVPPSRN